MWSTSSYFINQNLFWIRLLTPRRRWNVDLFRYRSTGCVVSGAKLQRKLEKQFTKMAAQKHGVSIMMPTCGVNDAKEVTVFVKKPKMRQPKVDQRRNTILASTIFPYICDIVNSGELGEEINALQMNLTKMEFAPDFSALRIFWYGGNGDLMVDDDVQKKLVDVGAKLRESLAQTSILPSIPAIVFVIDKQEQQKRRLLTALESIDLGPDHFESESSSELDSQSVKSPPKQIPQALRDKWKKKKDSHF